MKYDVIVVGAGSAGCALAGRLAEDANLSVLLLEAGPDYAGLENLPDELKYGYTRDAEIKGAPHNWGLEGTITAERGVIHVAQGKVVGGSGAINGQTFLRGIPEDYDSWASWGNDEWSYLKVLPYFRKMETDADIRDDFHGSDGPIPIVRRDSEERPLIQSALYQACAAAGYREDPDMNSPESEGVASIPMNNPDGIRMSTALTHLEPNRHKLNLTIKGNVYVRRVLFDGKRATGVEAESGGEIFTVEGEQIVLSGGGLRSPHLLLLSGVGPADHLRSLGIPVVHDLPGVGQNLRNHPNASVALKVKDGIEVGPDAPVRRTCLRLTASGSDSRADLMIQTSSDYMPISGEVLPLGEIHISVSLELPFSVGELKLSSADPQIQPQFNYHYLSDPRDRQRMREGVRLCAQFGEHQAYHEFIDGRRDPTDQELASDDALDAWLLKNVGTARHISGTCKMGPSLDSMAVVDQYCRVRGVEGLRVADTSVIPQVTRANTHATAVLVGERVSDWIKNDVPKSN